jgi:hypothetical protein
MHSVPVATLVGILSEYNIFRINGHFSDSMAYLKTKTCKIKTLITQFKVLFRGWGCGSSSRLLA